MNKLPIFEVILTDDEDILGLALVDNPAIQHDFLCFSEHIQKMIFNEDKMIVKGPALIPNQLIFRNDVPGGRYVYFSEQTIFDFVEKLMAKKDNQFNLGHTDKNLKANIIESYFSSVPNEFNVPKNSWIVSLKIEDQDVWQDIKSEKYNGFSIQGLFGTELVGKFEKQNSENMNEEIKNKLMNAINSILFGEKVELAVEEVTGVTVPVVEEVTGVTVPVIEPTPTVEVEPKQEVEQELKPLDEIKIKEMISESQTETINQLKAMIDELSTKIEKYGSTPEPSNPTTIESMTNPVQTGMQNPANKYFPNKLI